MLPFPSPPGFLGVNQKMFNVTHMKLNNIDNIFKNYQENGHHLFCMVEFLLASSYAITKTWKMILSSLPLIFLT